MEWGSQVVGLSTAGRNNFGFHEGYQTFKIRVIRISQQKVSTIPVISIKY